MFKEKQKHTDEQVTRLKEVKEPTEALAKPTKTHTEGLNQTSLVRGEDERATDKSEKEDYIQDEWEKMIEDGDGDDEYEPGADPFEDEPFRKDVPEDEDMLYEDGEPYMGEKEEEYYRRMLGPDNFQGEPEEYNFDPDCTPEEYDEDLDTAGPDDWFAGDDYE